MNNKKTILQALNQLAEVLFTHAIQYNNILIKLSKKDYIGLHNELQLFPYNTLTDVKDGSNFTIKVSIYTFNIIVSEETEQIITDFKYSIHSSILIDDFISNLQESLLLDSKNYRNIQKFI